MTIYKGLPNWENIVTTHVQAAVIAARFPQDVQLSQGRFYIHFWNALCVFSLDTGHHTSGWWKNPDYETCRHLSISFQDRASGDLMPRNHKIARKIVKAFFQAHSKWVWCEPPYSKEGKERDVWHYRLFVDKATLLPLFPRGEVYSRELTEAGWKSFSEVQAEIRKRENECMEEQ